MSRCRKGSPKIVVTVIASLVIAGATAAGARDARATPNFPDEIKAHLMLQASPPCAICHQGGVTGLGTVTTPFGKSMRAHGVVPFDLGSLDNALDQMKTDKVDSLHDGTDDIDDLIAGRDPNVPDGDGGANIHVDAVIIPAYGCGAHVAATSDAGDPWALLAGGAVAVVLGRRVRRRRG